MTEPKRAIIIGGGPAGLTAAYELIKTSAIQPVVLELSEFWGGISRTVNYKGNRIDIGGHRFFSKSDTVMKWWVDVLPIQSEHKELELTYQGKKSTVALPSEQQINHEDNIMLVRNRLSRIYYEKKFFNYPVSLTPDTVMKLGLFNTFLIGLSYLKSVAWPIKNEQNLEEFFINRFGKRLYRTFFKDYTEKVWGVKCADISAEWGAQRIKGLSITKTISHFIKSTFSKNKKKDLSQKNTETSLIEYFLYPKYGPGQMWEVVASTLKNKGAELHQKTMVEKIEVEGNKVKAVVAKNFVTGQTQRYEGDYFFSTMPVRELINAIDQPVPANVKEVANGLVYRDFITVGLLLKKMKIGKVKDNWIYIQEPYVKVGRLQIFNNWSPYMVSNDDDIWVGLEYFCNDTDELWNLSETDMKALAINEMVQMGLIEPDDVLDSVVIKMPKTYPAYFGLYNRFNEVREYIDNFENLFLVGRNGMHKYNNQDHSMLTAIEAVKNINNHITTKDNIWSINTEQEYHEEKK